MDKIQNKQTKVLVVDDEKTVCQSVEKILGRKGHQVDQALTVENALKMIEAQSEYDLIIADLMMPQVSGMELLKIVKERWPKMPVLMVTGYASIASAVEATRLGAVNYLPKPFTPDELATAVDKIIEGSFAPKEGTEPKKALNPPDLLDEGIIDVDMPFNAREVAQATSVAYVEQLTHSDILRTNPVEEAILPKDFCALGERSCKKFEKKGVCQTEECPIITAERKKAGTRKPEASILTADAIDVDLPFSAKEVAAATSDDYVAALNRSDLPTLAYWYFQKKSSAARRILVVDDEAVVVNSVRKALSRRDYTVEAAFTGKDALSHIVSRKYDLVLLDMRLPDTNGLDLLSTIKKHWPNLPVAVVTGYASIDTAVDAVQRGANDYMPKPFTPDELFSLTNRILEKVPA
jgi:DNA-binding response OmpR family regulator